MRRLKNALVICPAQSGQAMVEFVVISMLAVGLFLGIWYIGKFHDIQATTIQTARYAAWERTARPPSYSDTRLQSQARARLFSWNQDAFKANDGINNGQGWNQQTTMWMDHADDKRLIRAPDDVTLRTASAALPGREVGLAVAAVSALDAAGGADKLPKGGMFTSTVKVNIANLAHMETPLNALNLTLTEYSSVVADNWDAGSPKQAAARTEAFTPGSAFDFLDTGPFSLIKSALGAIEPAFKNFHPGQICPDVVPMDRITALNGNANANRPVYRGAQPCY
jgi:hypothetical protein